LCRQGAVPAASASAPTQPDPFEACVHHNGSLTRWPSPAGTFLDGARLEPRARARLALGLSTITLGRCPTAFQLLDGAARGGDAPGPPRGARREAAADGAGAPDTFMDGAPAPEALDALDGADAPRAVRRYRSAGRGADAGDEPGPDPRRAAHPADKRRGWGRGGDAAAEGDGPAGSGAWERHDRRGGCGAGERAERDREAGGDGGDGAGWQRREARGAHGPDARSQATPDGRPRADRPPERGRPDRLLGAPHERREPDARPASPRAGPGPAFQRPGGPGARAGAEGRPAERSGAGRARERSEPRERQSSGRNDAGRRGDPDGDRGDSRGRLDGAEHRGARRTLRQADRRGAHPADPSMLFWEHAFVQELGLTSLVPTVACVAATACRLAHEHHYGAAHVLPACKQQQQRQVVCMRLRLQGTDLRICSRRCAGMRACSC
jgi:hypothetical protein